MRLGYSHWGFLGDGIADTPDGGRSWRTTMLNTLATDHQPVLLQPNRDLAEAGHDVPGPYTWHQGLPDLDALFLEWRWPLPGRNITACGTPGHTCDLHRQQELLDHYTARGVPTLIWDLDRTLAADDPLRTNPTVRVLDPAGHPPPGARTLRVPVADHVLDTADPEQLASGRRPWALGYVGNQYGRDEHFDRFFAPAAHDHLHQVIGKWTDTDRWPHVVFAGRRPFAAAQQLHCRAVTTVLLAPPRYADTGAISQRLPEAVLAGCLPLGPTDIATIDRFLPSELLISDGRAASRLIDRLQSTTDRRRADLIGKCIRRLDPFRASQQLAVINAALADIGSPAPGIAPTRPSTNASGPITT
ncbi:hypothetical protein ACFV4P_02825 [Kitasatospora sp. NPDC059795]|uniref:hypothetical protein n=1 Tax=Kitasatospora sp. NPDC059795 TaxID=3346949 RepID=UPI00366017B8